MGTETGEEGTARGSGLDQGILTKERACYFPPSLHIWRKGQEPRRCSIDPCRLLS
jgi:hypothetical protein